MTSQAFWPALIGAAAGGAASLAAGLLMYLIIARRDDRRLLRTEQMKVHLDAVTWWGGARPVFQRTSSDIADEVRRLESTGIEPLLQARTLAPLVCERIEALQELVPAALITRLYLYGGEQSDRQFVVATQRLEALHAVANRVASGEASTAAARGDGAGEDVVGLLRAPHVLDGLIQAMDALKVTLAVDNVRLRRRVRAV